jgi:hypothetical protein
MPIQMSVFEVFAALIFVASSGLLFNKRFRDNGFLLAVAGIIALVATYYLTRAIAEDVLRNSATRQAATQLAPTQTVAPILSTLKIDQPSGGPRTEELPLGQTSGTWKYDKATVREGLLSALFDRPVATTAVYRNGELVKSRSSGDVAAMDGIDAVTILHTPSDVGTAITDQGQAGTTRIVIFSADSSFGCEFLSHSNKLSVYWSPQFDYIVVLDRALYYDANENSVEFDLLRVDGDKVSHVANLWLKGVLPSKELPMWNDDVGQAAFKIDVVRSNRRDIAPGAIIKIIWAPPQLVLQNGGHKETIDHPYSSVQTEQCW